MLTVREDRGSIAASVQHKIFSETLTQQKHETTNTVQLSLPGNPGETAMFDYF